jgi:hypothetical protein
MRASMTPPKREGAQQRRAMCTQAGTFGCRTQVARLVFDAVCERTLNTSSEDTRAAAYPLRDRPRGRTACGRSRRSTHRHSLALTMQQREDGRRACAQPRVLTQTDGVVGVAGAAEEGSLAAAEGDGRPKSRPPSRPKSRPPSLGQVASDEAMSRSPRDEPHPSSVCASAPHSAVTTANEHGTAAFTPDTAMEPAATVAAHNPDAPAAAGAHEPLLASLFTALVSRVVQVRFRPLAVPACALRSRPTQGSSRCAPPFPMHVRSIHSPQRPQWCTGDIPCASRASPSAANGRLGLNRSPTRVCGGGVCGLW